mmetsp:Transcript_36614/g.97655  ORF Transcript_36614/g.97655 Transcript_36614/m.97655 type:complete len:204 (-) Transcript_36614:662-1273(-)
MQSAPQSGTSLCVALSDAESEDKVRTAAVVVHICVRRFPAPHPLLQGGKRLFRSLHYSRQRVGTLKTYTRGTRDLMDIHHRVCSSRGEQVANAFVVDLKDCDSDPPTRSSREFTENSVHRARRHTLLVPPGVSQHCVRLARARLPVRNDSAIVSPQHSVANGRHSLRKHLLLGGVRAPGEVASVRHFGRVGPTPDASTQSHAI